MDRKSSIILAAAAVAASRYHTSDVSHPVRFNTDTDTTDTSWSDSDKGPVEDDKVIVFKGMDRGHGNHAVHDERDPWKPRKVKREPPPKTGIAALPLRMRKRLLQRIRDERKKPRGVFISECLARDLGFDG